MGLTSYGSHVAFGFAFGVESTQAKTEMIVGVPKRAEQVWQKFE